MVGEGVRGALIKMQGVSAGLQVEDCFGASAAKAKLSFQTNLRLVQLELDYEFDGREACSEM